MYNPGIDRSISTNFCFVALPSHVYAEALVTAGEHLEDESGSAADSALGLLAQAIGFWWGDETNEGFCVKACEEVILDLNAALRVRIRVFMGWKRNRFHKLSK
jgi:hypothetical protein